MTDSKIFVIRSAIRTHLGGTAELSRLAMSTKVDSEKAERTLIVARSNLIREQPFFGQLALRLTLVETTWHPTLWTDGKLLGYNPRFILGLSMKEVEGCVCHEVLHCTNGHPWRRGARDKAVWNEACDYAINPYVLDSGFALPAGVLLDRAYTGKAAEEIYADLMHRPRQQQPQQPQGSEESGAVGAGTEGAGDEESGDDVSRPYSTAAHNIGEVRDAEGDVAEHEQIEWRIATMQAARVAKAQDRLPACIVREITEWVAPRVPWRQLLRRFLQGTAIPADYSWGRPSARHLASGLYLPSLQPEERVAQMVVAVDTSGSIGTRELNVFASEINAIRREVTPERITVLYCDAQVHRVQVFETDEPLKLEPIGGGGTDFRPVFEWVAQMFEPPTCLVYLTDMEGVFPQHAPSYSVLWAQIGRGRIVPPFGAVVRVDFTQ